MPETITVHRDVEVLFRLHAGRRPLVYPDTVVRILYETGIDVVHVGTVWALGYLDGVEALELDDGTVVAIADIDPDSFILNPTQSIQRATEDSSNPTAVRRSSRARRRAPHD